MTDWLDDDEEQTIHTNRALIPNTPLQLQRTTEAPAVLAHGEAGAPAAAASSFDDDWNW